jgi:hypothetical protein
MVAPKEKAAEGRLVGGAVKTLVWFRLAVQQSRLHSSSVS